jgi:Flp pilus assembly protein TadG
MATSFWRKRFSKLRGAGTCACQAETRLDPCRVEARCAGSVDKASAAPRRAGSRRRARQRGAVMIITTLVVPLVLIPMVGLAIDATVLRIVQARLSAAVDGAALGSGRLLGTTANAQEIAGEFLNANFQVGRSGLWNAYNLQSTVNVTLGVTKTVAISATADVPLMFSRIFNQSYSVVSAAGTATRRDSRVELVIDRSGSMTASDGDGSTVIADLIAYAQGFAEKFTEGTDELGLVVYDGSAVVGYPTTRPWDSTTTKTSTGGPDTSFYSGGATDMIHQIAAVKAAGFTGMAEGLWLAYIEIQKAHMKDLVADGGVDDRMNSIILFTDGFPTAVTVHLNNAADNSIVSTSKCTYKANDAQKMIGWVGITGPTGTTWGAISGVYGLASSDTTENAAWWMANSWINNSQGDSEPGAPVPATPEAACTGIYSDYSSNPNSYFATSGKTDLKQVPNIDGWGNSLDGTAYSNSSIVTSTGTAATPYAGTLNHANMTTASNWALAAWNEADNTANNIRNDSNLVNRTGDTENLLPTIYTIGYEGDGGVDQGLLLRIANDKGSSSYNSSQATGMYVPAANSNALADAFNTIASAILRLSK